MYTRIFRKTHHILKTGLIKDTTNTYWHPAFRIL